MFLFLKFNLKISICCLLIAVAVTCFAEKPKVVSLDTRVDGILLQLADPGQILAIRESSRLPENSLLWKQAQAIPELSHNAGEEIYKMHPDYVYFGAWSDWSTQRLLKRLGIHTERWGEPESWEQLFAEIHLLGDQLEHQERASLLVDAMQQRLCALEQVTATCPRKRAIYYVGSGSTKGQKCIINEMIESAGMINIAAEIGMEGMGKLDVESLVMLHPDVIIFTDYQKDTPTLSRQVLEHPVFDQLRDQITVIELDYRKMNTPGMAYLDCVELMARAAYPEAFRDLCAK
ncbi:MAG: ABC transporter substrate-binding protein [Opitutales bacterium]|nr:ABC transporter substrate-binding protein [Opitutales bacterium]